MAEKNEKRGRSGSHYRSPRVKSKIKKRKSSSSRRNLSKPFDYKGEGSLREAFKLEKIKFGSTAYDNLFELRNQLIGIVTRIYPEDEMPVVIGGVDRGLKGKLSGEELFASCLSLLGDITSAYRDVQLNMAGSTREKAKLKTTLARLAETYNLDPSLDYMPKQD